MRSALLRRRLTWTLALVAWFAQLCLPVAHAAMVSTPHAPMAAWCGDPANAWEAAAALPPEIRDALADDEAIDASHLAHCAVLCAVGTAAAALPAPVKADLPHASAAPPLTARPVPVVVRRHALPPPSRGPPARA